MPRPPSLSYELLQTFVSVIANDGDAVAAANALGINQPSMSKRLAVLQRRGPVLRDAWLERTGKKWRLTGEGARVWSTVEDVVRRYENLRAFAVAAPPAGLAVACGQDAVAGIVLAAAREFRRARPDCAFRISTPSGQARIEGVAAGNYDLALVTHAPARIAEIARRELHVEDLYEDPLVLASAPSASFAAVFAKLPDSGVTAKALASLPLVLPEPGTGLRQPLDDRLRELGHAAAPVVEGGGWPALLEYVKDGFGVGLLPRSVVSRDRTLMQKSPQAKIVPANVIRLICRYRLRSTSDLDLTEDAADFRVALSAEAKRGIYGSTVR